MPNWEIKEKRSERGSLLSMTLSEGVDAPNEMGPVTIVRQLHVRRELEGQWSIELTGPRGGVQDRGQFSEAGLRSFLTRLRVEME